MSYTSIISICNGVYHVQYNVYPLVKTWSLNLTNKKPWLEACKFNQRGREKLSCTYISPSQCPVAQI